MKFRVEWHKKARKELRKLPKYIAKRLILEARTLEKDPMQKSEPLSGSEYRKIRAGDYRAIIDILFDEKIVEIRRVGHRKHIYKKLFR